MFILAIDQGTTSTRVVLYDTALSIIHISQKAVQQIIPQKGYLEHNPEQIFSDLIFLINHCLEQSCHKLNIQKQNLLNKISSIGITNQRETTVIWDKSTGKPIHHAIVWQDRRTSSYCKSLSESNNKLEQIIKTKTGLIIDPYFSASKIHWLLNEYKDLSTKNMLFGTMDSYLIWHLTNGKVHATDHTNASRTMLYNLHTLSWDNDLLEIFNIPSNILPVIKNCVDHYGETDKSYFGASIPIYGVAGDQQAAAIGQLCIHQNDCKITYGTGCFIIQNTGKTIVHSKHKLISTIAYKIDSQVNYGLEGSIFTAGSAVQWLRDTMKFIKKAEDTEMIASSIDNTNGVYVIPAFNGLGAPHWRSDARGVITGLSHDTGTAHIIRATLESVAYQTQDLILAYQQDFGIPNHIKVDGGMTANNWFLQFLADITRLDIVKPNDIESTVKGAAILAGIGSEIFSSLKQLTMQDINTYNVINPLLDKQIAHQYYSGWQKAIQITA